MIIIRQCVFIIFMSIGIVYHSALAESMPLGSVIQEGDRLPGTKLLVDSDDLADKMMDGLHRFIERKIENSVSTRQELWQYDFSSQDAYERSIESNRERFLKIIGAVDERARPSMEWFRDDVSLGPIADVGSYCVWQVRWSVLEGVTGEGILLEPKSKPVACVIALPDADQTPEQIAGLSPGVAPESQFARRLAENGFQVIVPVLISREIDFSGNPRVGWADFSGEPKIGLTNQTHREWIYRQAYHMGRHVIGYEVQKVRSAVDWLESTIQGDIKIGVMGYGEGGLIAFYTAAVDTRIDVALVSGYFDTRQRTWEEPLYRNVWSLLYEFGDAEITSMIAPRGLVVEHSRAPEIPGPPDCPEGRLKSAAVGRLVTPTVASAVKEFRRLETLVSEKFQSRHFVYDKNKPLAFGSVRAMKRFAALLGVDSKMDISSRLPIDNRLKFDPKQRQKNQVQELERHVQGLIRISPQTRNNRFLNQTSLMRTIPGRWNSFSEYENWLESVSAEEFAREVAPQRDSFWTEVLGKLNDAKLPVNPRSRKIYDKETWTGYTVVLDVLPDVFAWGILLLPKDLKPGEKRPVVVCQHGRNGVPKNVIEGDLASYHDFAARLAEQGFIVFAPHNPYRGEDRYRLLDRKGNLVKATLFSFILAQHECILEWLSSLPEVDAERIAFYGLSYGGETAVRIPPILEQYCLSICSADFNDWAQKVASTESSYSFMFSIEWEMPYFNMGNTFNYAEAAYLMVPRPFMVERGQHDGVAPDSWVASEYAKVRWLYTQLGLGERTEIEFFNRGHTINGKGTFEFLHHHLKWPQRFKVQGSGFRVK